MNKMFSVLTLAAAVFSAVVAAPACHKHYPQRHHLFLPNLP